MSPRTSTSTRMISSSKVDTNLEKNVFYTDPQTSRRYVTCNICYRVFFTVKGLNIHMVEHDSKNKKINEQITIIDLEKIKPGEDAKSPPSIPEASNDIEIIVIDSESEDDQPMVDITSTKDIAKFPKSLQKRSEEVTPIGEEEVESSPSNSDDIIKLAFMKALGLLPVVGSPWISGMKNNEKEIDYPLAIDKPSLPLNSCQGLGKLFHLQKEEIIFNCHICPSQHKSFLSLRRHQKFTHQNIDLISKISTKRKNSDQHKKPVCNDTQEVKRLSGSKCPSTYKYAYSMRRHKHFAHINMTSTTCDKCFRFFETRRGLVLHKVKCNDAHDSEKKAKYSLA